MPVPVLSLWLENRRSKDGDGDDTDTRFSEAQSSMADASI